LVSSVYLCLVFSKEVWWFHKLWHGVCGLVHSVVVDIFGIPKNTKYTAFYKHMPGIETSGTYKALLNKRLE